MADIRYEYHIRPSIRLRDSTNETFNLLENLLGWARAQKGELVFAPRHEDVCEVIKDTTMLLKSVAASKDITIKELLPKSATAHFGPSNG